MTFRWIGINNEQLLIFIQNVSKIFKALNRLNCNLMNTAKLKFSDPHAFSIRMIRNAFIKLIFKGNFCFLPCNFRIIKILIANFLWCLNVFVYCFVKIPMLHDTFANN